MDITVCHYPPGTSKGNKIEHRLFSRITHNWRGRPLDETYLTIVNLIAHTMTTTNMPRSPDVDDLFGTHRLARSATALSPAGLWTPRQRRRTLIMVRAMHRTARRINPLVAARLAETAAGRTLLAGIIVARPALLEPAVLIEDLRALVDAVAFVSTLAAGKRIVFAGAIPDVPVTIAWGTRDRIMRRPRAELVTRLIPHARLLSLPGCGHVPMTDNPALVAHVLLTGSDDRTRSVAGDSTSSRAAS